MHKIIPRFFSLVFRGSYFARFRMKYVIYQDQILICLHSNANTISSIHCVNNVVSFNLNDISMEIVRALT